ncbi:Abi family protein [Arcanobacterium canis]
MAAKVFKTHGEQIALLRSRGMDITDEAAALHVLERVNYYRLSGYWYPFRVPSPDGAHRLDEFIEGTAFDDVVSLYAFDERLRVATFTVLTPIELALRSMLGHELGRIDPLIHLRPELLGPVARKSISDEPSKQYSMWHGRYSKELSVSREDFVAHHRHKYGGQLPVWAAVEVMDWGSLTYLYRLAPSSVRDTLSARAGLTAAQLGSWIKVLNIVRNYSAHHARMFNRVYALKPRLPKTGTHLTLDAVAPVINRCFGQLTLIQYLLKVWDIGDQTLLPEVVATYPNICALPISHLGAPDNWHELPLWNTWPSR